MNHSRSALLGLVSVLVLAGCATAPSASEKAAVAFDYSKLDKPPQTRFMARPDYPPELRLAGVEGYATVDFIVGTDGAVTGAFVAKASDERFGPAALAAVQKWKFTPGELKGAVVECDMQVPIRFQLEVEPGAAGDLNPVEAVLQAANHPEGVRGTFRFTVRRVGRQDGNVYIDSESDYRDPRCLVIAVPGSMESAVAAKFGLASVDALVGRTVRVTGTAKRVTIWFTENGVRSDSFYYQTHVRVRGMAQLDLVPAAP